MGQASWALWNHAPTSASVAEAMTLRMMLLTMWMGPFRRGGVASGLEDGVELRKKMPPARERALLSERYEASL